MGELVNILIRTHRRPTGFRRLMDSIKSQNYTNYRIIVSVDDVYSLSYVHEYGFKGDDIVMIDKELIDNEIMSRYIGHKAPYNLYFNLLIDRVKDGYVYCMDDDDYFFDETSLSEIMSNVEKDTLSIYKMSIWGTEIPSSRNWGKDITIADIGTPCFCVHSKYAKMVSWGFSYTADGEYIQSLSMIVPKIKWVDKVVYVVPINSRGVSEV